MTDKQIEEIVRNVLRSYDDGKAWPRETVYRVVMAACRSVANAAIATVTTVVAPLSSQACPSCGAYQMAWGPTVGLWACMTCKKSFRPDEMGRP